MGIKLIDLSEVDSGDIIPSGSIEYPDLVRTLREDPTKYLKPVMNSAGEITHNKIFFDAAKEAGVKRMLFEVLGDYEDEHPHQRRPDEIIRNYIFFKTDLPKDPSSLDKLSKIVAKYFDGCQNALNNQLVNIGDVYRAEHPIIEPDMMECILYGNLKSSENKQKLMGPTREFYSALNDKIAKIRSVNGMKPDSLEVLTF